MTTKNSANLSLTIVLLSMILPLSAISENRRSLEDIRMDSTISNHKLIYFGKGDEPSRDSTNNLIQKFYEDQFRHFQDPLAPYFLFLSKDSKLAMGIGG